MSTALATRPYGFTEAARQYIDSGEDNQFSISGVGMPMRNVIAPRTVGANAFRIALDAVGAEVFKVDKVNEISVPHLNMNMGAKTDVGMITISSGESVHAVPISFQSGTAWFPRSLVDYTDILTFADNALGYAAERAVEKDVISQILNDVQVVQTSNTSSTTNATSSNIIDALNTLPDLFADRQFVVLQRQAFRAAMKDGLLRFHPDMPGVSIMPDGTPVVSTSSLELFGASARVVGLAISASGFVYADYPDGRTLTRYENISTRPDSVGLNLFVHAAVAYHPSAIVKIRTP